MTTTDSLATIDFATLTSRWESELSSLKGSASLNLELPSPKREQGLTQIEFRLSTVNGDDLTKALATLKKFIANVRIHTWEEGNWTLQALNENLFETKGLIHNYKVKIHKLSESYLVFISKKDDFTEDEFQASLALFRVLALSGSADNDPSEALTELGVTVFEPTAKSELSWEDFAGYQSTKKAIQENVILPFRKPELYDEITSLTRKTPISNRPQAILFTGKPGVGKTTMARIIGTQIKAPVVYVPVESILSKYYGQSSKMMASIFEHAAEFKHSILFLDEIDSLAGQRNQNMFEATRRILSVLLRKMDGLDQKPNVLVIGATNRAQDLDAALLSRFDITLNFPLPNLEDRSAILGFYAQQLSEEERKRVAEKLDGVSAREMRDICEMAERAWARLLLKHNKPASPPTAEAYLKSVDNALDAKAAIVEDAAD